MYKYFKDNEIKGLKKELVQLLDQAREMAGIAFVITSGFRDKAKNAEVGGVENSSHTKGLAVDMRAQTSQNRAIIVESLLRVGIKRIGVYKRHIHADIDTSKPTPSMWLG
jgi:uncharacterized protein YcbK (DUF882 family)